MEKLIGFKIFFYITAISEKQCEIHHNDQVFNFCIYTS